MSHESRKTLFIVVGYLLLLIIFGVFSYRTGLEAGRHDFAKAITSGFHPQWSQ
jgi:hypothetical protein